MKARIVAIESSERFGGVGENWILIRVEDASHGYKELKVRESALGPIPIVINGDVWIEFAPAAAAVQS